MIRVATKTDTQAIRALFDLCFLEEGSFNAYFFERIFLAKHTLVLECDGQIAAMLQRLPRILQVGDLEMPVTYIYGACTHPAFRRRALMSRLLEHSHALDIEKGIGASVLIPQETWLYDFYAQYGYELAFFTAKEPWEQHGDVAELPVPIKQSQLQKVNACYEHLTGSCYIKRDEDDWRAQLMMFQTLGTGAYGFWKHGVLTGYAFCWGDTVQEGFGLTTAQKDGLLKVCAQQRLKIVSAGQSTPAGCARWHRDAISMKGYMNLLFN